jgi:hypothetical protein
MRNDLYPSRKWRPIRSLTGQLPQVAALTRGSVPPISRDMFSIIISKAYLRRRGIRTPDESSEGRRPSSEWSNLASFSLVAFVGRTVRRENRRHLREQDLVDDSQRGKNTGADRADVPSRPTVAQWQRAYRATLIVSSAFTSNRTVRRLQTRSGLSAYAGGRQPVR